MPVHRIAFSVILFTLGETSYARELAPLAGHVPIQESSIATLGSKPISNGASRGRTGMLI